MQVNRRANMMLDQLIKGQIKPAKGAALQGSFLWATALLSASTAVYFCYQAYYTPAQPLWAAQEYQVAQAELDTVNIVDDISNNLVFAGLEEAMLMESDEGMEKRLDPVVFDAVEQEADAMVMEDSEALLPTAVEASEEDNTELVSLTESVPEWLDKTEGFTVQVLATPDEMEAQRVAKHYEHSHVLHAARQNKPTYVVLVGEFNDFSIAKAEVEKLEQEHEGLHPWVRRYSQLRDDVEHLKDIEQ